MKYLFFLSAILFTLAACNNSKNESGDVSAEKSVPTAPEAPALPTPNQLPSFSVMNEQGNMINLDAFKGKKVFVNLWATWCAPCRAEIPSIKKLAAKTDRSKTEFVLLSLDDDFEKAKRYATETKIGLPVYYPAANLPPLFSVNSIPTTFIFNEKGELIHQEVGGINYDTPMFVEMLTVNGEY